MEKDKQEKAERRAIRQAKMEAKEKERAAK
jgi:hypothetical protein